MTLLNKFIFIFFMIFSALASAAESVAERVLAASFNDRQIYASGRCGDNVARLAVRMHFEGVDLSEARVIYVLNEKKMTPPVPAMRKSPLEPKGARGNPETWAFHVILVMPDADDQILVYDLDASPRAIPVKKYFARLFPDSNTGSIYDTGDRLKNITIREIPLPMYLQDIKNLGGDAGAAKYQQEFLPGLATFSVRAYLNSLP
jgi:hypothetical protein